MYFTNSKTAGFKFVLFQSCFVTCVLICIWVANIVADIMDIAVVVSDMVRGNGVNTLI